MPNDTRPVKRGVLTSYRLPADWHSRLRVNVRKSRQRPSAQAPRPFQHVSIGEDEPKPLARRLSSRATSVYNLLTRQPSSSDRQASTPVSSSHRNRVGMNRECTLRCGLTNIGAPE